MRKCEKDDKSHFPPILERNYKKKSFSFGGSHESLMKIVKMVLFCGGGKYMTFLR